MENLENSKWECKSVITDGEDFFINSLNIRNHQWTFTGETVIVKDPKYNKIFKADIYKIILNQIQVDFAAIEFSNCVWGIYQKS